MVSYKKYIFVNDIIKVTNAVSEQHEKNLSRNFLNWKW